MVNFNTPLNSGREIEYINMAIKNNKISGDGDFTKKCSDWLESRFKVSKVLLTTSCTHALEMAAILAGIREGDEVIMPSYTFVSTANAFVLRGAKIVFIDVRPDTMNLDERLIQEAITKRTKAIVPVHYAGVSCEMNEICRIARENDLLVIEDAAQGMMSTYNGKPLGSIGDYGCYSFHETKNYTMGEGGAILINNNENIERAEIIREKGTNRSKFFRGQIDKYTWVDIGSSYLPSEINAAYLWAQLEIANKINNDRLTTWNTYYNGLKNLEVRGLIKLPNIPPNCTHNGHMFYIKLKDLNERTRLIEYLKNNGIMSVFHYIPLHSSPAGQRYGHFYGQDVYTTRESERLLRLPLYYGLEDSATKHIIKTISTFFDNGE